MHNKHFENSKTLEIPLIRTVQSILKQLTKF